jgi:hypothetical protein
MSVAGLSNKAVEQEILLALAPLGAVSMEEELAHEPPIGRMRRHRPGNGADDVGVLTLLDVDGVLMWEDGAVNVSSSLRRRRGAGPAPIDGDVVTQVKFSKALGRSSVVERLRTLDASLTPRADRVPDGGSSRLLEYDPKNGWAATVDATPKQNGRILLFVHGTFSNTERMVSELRVDGEPFLDKAAGYDQILGFDHYTLSRTPLVNAVELTRLFANSRAELDIVCHSRGGLVVRWFVEMLDRQPQRKRRVVFVGCPLRGTSLADPQSIRNGLNLMTNVGRVLGEAGSLVPLLAAAGGLVQVLSSVGGFGAGSPVIDVGLGLVPGLSAMSRIRNNAELDLLNVGSPSGTDYFAVASDFRTEDAGWRFWRMFNMLKGADWAADALVFNQENDLVVDTESMTHHAFGENPKLDDEMIFCRFNGTSGVHHTNYFRHERTRKFLVRSLGL